MMVIQSRLAPRLPFLVWLTMLGATWAPSAQADPIVTDRPDIAESSLAVPRGWYQVEQGVEGETGKDGLSLNFPSLHRFGIFPNVEMRIETSIVSLAPKTAFPGLAVGAKWHVLDGGEWGQWPSLAVLAHAEVAPDGGVYPVGKLLLDTSLPWGFDLGVNAGSYMDETGWAFGYAASVSHDVTETVRLYAEFSGDHGFNGALPALGIDGGTAWLITDAIQFDAAIYRGLTPASPDWYLTTGLSARWGPEPDNADRRAGPIIHDGIGSP